MTDSKSLAAPAAETKPAAPVPPGTPAWVRPDDAEREARLNAMKHRATGLLALAAAVFVVAGILEPAHAWLGYVRATAEASLVGGLADWFAVTALFRRPLGLPIPHTAIVSTRKERIGRILGNFVQNHFLSRDVIAANLLAVRPAERAARWLSDSVNARRIARQVASGLAKTLDALPTGEVRAMMTQLVRARLRDLRVAPALGKTLAVVLAGNRQQDLLSLAVGLAAQAVHDNREVIRDRVRAESPWWVPGVIDDKLYQKILSAIERLLRDVGADSLHPLRRTFDAALGDFIDRLQHSPDVIKRAEAMKADWLSDPQVEELAGRLWDEARHAVVAYATGAEGAPPGPLEPGIAPHELAMIPNAAAAMNARIARASLGGPARASELSRGSPTRLGLDHHHADHPVGLVLR